MGSVLLHRVVMFPVIVSGLGCWSMVVECLPDSEYKEIAPFGVFAICSSPMVIKLVLLTLDELA